MATKNEKTEKICPKCNGSGGEYREVQEIATKRWTKKRFTCPKCSGKGKIS